MPSFRNELSNDQEIATALVGEERRQQDGVELIPSENYTYPEVLELLGSVFTNKYSEGYPGRRYYGGQQYTDKIENLARQRACSLFRAEHANVQPLSGSPMNQAVYLGLLKPGDTILAMDLSHGGHLTHGAPVSHMGRLFNFIRYKTAPSNGGAMISTNSAGRQRTSASGWTTTIWCSTRSSRRPRQRCSSCRPCWRGWWACSCGTPRGFSAVRSP